EILFFRLITAQNGYKSTKGDFLPTFFPKGLENAWFFRRNIVQYIVNLNDVKWRNAVLSFFVGKHLQRLFSPKINRMEFF
ncbi:MAG: hypothetical protein J6A24_03680, partial [Clostridia bacterium]|nr:hypothetical protein [Clostridia bacterium]